MIKESFNSSAIKVMNAYRGMYTSNTAYIPLNWKDIRNRYMNELYDIPPFAVSENKNMVIIVSYGG